MSEAKEPTPSPIERALFEQLDGVHVYFMETQHGEIDESDQGRIDALNAYRNAYPEHVCGETTTCRAAMSDKQKTGAAPTAREGCQFSYGLGVCGHPCEDAIHDEGAELSFHKFRQNAAEPLPAETKPAPSTPALIEAFCPKCRISVSNTTAGVRECPVCHGYVAKPRPDSSSASTEPPAREWDIAIPKATSATLMIIKAGVDMELKKRGFSSTEQTFEEAWKEIYPTMCDMSIGMHRAFKEVAEKLWNAAKGLK